MIKSYSLTVLAFLVLLTGCQKDSDVFVPNDGQQLDSAWVTSIQPNAQVVQLTNKIVGVISAETVSAANDTSIRTNTGFVIEIPKGALLSSGGAEYTGSVRAEFTLVQRKGDFIRFGIPTIGNRYPLESGGAFYIRFITSSGGALAVNSAKRIYIKFVDELAKQGMSLYYSASLPTATSSFNWAPTADNSVVNLWSTSTVPVQKGYTVTTTRTGWLNVEKQFEQGLTTTEVKVVMPDLFSNANTAVFMVFKSVRSVVQLSGNNNLRAFTFPNIPVNYDVKFVTISKVGDSFYLGSKDEKITSNHSTFIRPELSSMDKIHQFLNSL